MKRILVCGSRSVSPDPREIHARLGCFGAPNEVVIVSGGARGADEAAEETASQFGYRLEVFPANWEKYGKRAGLKRNIEMLDSGIDCVLAFWDGKSPGAAHTLTEAEKRGIQVWTILMPSATVEST